MFADDHAGIDLGAGLNEHGPTILQVEHGVDHGFTFAIGNQRTSVAAGDVAHVGCIGMEQAVHDGGAAGV